MKKSLLKLTTLLILPLISSCSVHQANADEQYTIPVPDPEPVYPLPEPVNMPEKPNLPAYDKDKAPYIGAVNSTTDAYQYHILKEGETPVGASVSYNNSKELVDYNFMYFDIYNFNKEYSFIRFDLESIVGVEGISIGAMYQEAYDQNKPAVGILSESLLDGDYSFAVDLSKFLTIDKNFNQEKKSNLLDKTISRLFIYIDSIPAKHPTDLVGSLNIKKISFLKEGDPLTEVDNSPIISSFVNNGNYTSELKYEEDEAFRLTTTSSPSSFVRANIKRFNASYGTLKIEYDAVNLSKFELKLNGSSYGKFDLSSSGELTFDFREVKEISALDIYLSGSGATQFVAKSFKFFVTPYCTDYWHATSRFSRCESKGIGGKVVASYQYGVGWDYISTKVVHWNTSFANMEIKMKLSGDTRAGLPERYGISVNSNEVITELQFNSFKTTAIDLGNNVYLIKTSLASVKKLGALNFYFDSEYINEFTGTRTVEILSIDFKESIPGVGEMVDVNKEGSTVTHLGDGWEQVSWGTNKTPWDKIGCNANLFSNKTPILKVEMKSASPFTLGIYYVELAAPTNEKQIKTHTAVNGDTTWEIDLRPFNLPESFAFRLFFDGGKTGTTGNVQIKMSFMKEAK